jgi:hypothetical protein
MCRTFSLQILYDLLQLPYLLENLFLLFVMPVLQILLAPVVTNVYTGHTGNAITTEEDAVDFVVEVEDNFS